MITNIEKVAKIIKDFADSQKYLDFIEKETNKYSIILHYDFSKELLNQARDSMKDVLEDMQLAIHIKDWDELIAVNIYSVMLPYGGEEWCESLSIDKENFNKEDLLDYLDENISDKVLLDNAKNNNTWEESLKESSLNDYENKWTQLARRHAFPPKPTKYYIDGYYDDKYRGLANSECFDDPDKAFEYVWELLQKGNYVKVNNWHRLSPDDVQEPEDIPNEWFMESLNEDKDLTTDWFVKNDVDAVFYNHKGDRIFETDQELGGRWVFVKKDKPSKRKVFKTLNDAMEYANGLYERLDDKLKEGSKSKKEEKITPKHYKDTKSEYDFFDLGYIEGVNYSAKHYLTWLGKKDFYVVKSHRPYNDADYHYAYSDNGKEWKLKLNNYVKGKVTTDFEDFSTVAKKLYELDKLEKIEPKLVIDSLKIEKSNYLGESSEEQSKLDTFNDKMDFLAKDEDEAIAGYKKVIKTIDNENVKDQLKKIETEEKAHKKYLERVKKNKNLKYTEPLDGSSEEDSNLEEKYIKNLYNKWI